MIPFSFPAMRLCQVFVHPPRSTHSPSPALVPLALETACSPCPPSSPGGAPHPRRPRHRTGSVRWGGGGTRLPNRNAPAHALGSRFPPVRDTSHVMAPLCRVRGASTGDGTSPSIARDVLFDSDEAGRSMDKTARHRTKPIPVPRVSPHL